LERALSISLSSFASNKEKIVTNAIRSLGYLLTNAKFEELDTTILPGLLDKDYNKDNIHIKLFVKKYCKDEEKL
jgi:hypothetical protein